jgi:hypothetical protein
MKLKLSDTSKMRGTAKSWSTLAVVHCPGSRITSKDVTKYKTKKVGDLVPACADCYAAKGMYHMPNVKAPRIHNAEDWKRDTWEDDMVETLVGHKRFRLFDSGDCFHIELANKLYRVMKRSPNTDFWFPTRMHKLPKFRPILAKMAKLSNVVVRKSSDSIEGKRIAGKNTSTIIASSLARSYSVGHTCPATVPGNKANCKANDCTACWDKEVKVINYVFH